MSEDTMTDSARHRVNDTGMPARGDRAIGRLITGAIVATLLLAGVPAMAQGQASSQGAGRGIQAGGDHPVLPIGSPLPDFTLPGVDGKMHKAADYATARVLAVVFESNHCPVSQLYEGRIEKLYEDYRRKGVTLVAINPNNPKTVRLDELGYTDVTDSLPEMKLRAGLRGIDWPYLYDGDTQATSIKFGAVATPHIFIFDQQRKLRYQGRIDDNQREDLVKSHDARNAIDALLSGSPVPVAETKAFGCTTKWLSKASGVEQEWARIQAEPVTVDMVGAEDLKKLRANPTDKVTVVYMWSTGCAACTSQFSDLETTFRMYRKRAFNLITINTNGPADAPAVLGVLKKEYASSPNKQFATTDRAGLQAAWGDTWNLSAPLTMAIAPGGNVLYRKEGKIDILDLRRIVLANLPDTGYVGSKAYWMKALQEAKKR
jgi:peroxiredoxin